MARLLDNERGMTLIELLAVLVLVSLVTGIIWSTLNISSKHNELETTKLQMQLEANGIITKLQSVHRKYNCYAFTESEEFVSIGPCKGRDKPVKEILSSSMKYDIQLKNNWLPDEASTTNGNTYFIEPNKENLSFDRFSLYVKEKNGNIKTSINIPTTISRIKNTEDG